MRGEERSVGALVMALVALGLLAFAFTAPWFHYDFSTPRQTAPDGPHPEEETGVERRTLLFDADGWHGDAEPSDRGTAQAAVDAIRFGTLAAGGLLVLVALGEVPWIASVLRRPVSLALLGVALVGFAGVVAATWFWLPESLAGLGVDSQYTARLGEEGYTHTTMGHGWYAAALAWTAVFATALFKFQAGAVDPRMVEAHGA